MLFGPDGKLLLKSETEEFDNYGDEVNANRDWPRGDASGNAALLKDESGSLWQALDSGIVVPAKEAPTGVDLFCGCGGFSLGMMQGGWNVLAALENDPAPAITYMVNLGTHPIDIRFVEPEDEQRLEDYIKKLWKRERRGVSGSAEMSVSGSARPAGRRGVPVFWFGDVTKLSGERILQSIGLKKGELGCVFGGPPCQGFSYAGNREVADPRNNLVFEFARLVCEMKPRTICMENVPGIKNMPTATGGNVLDEFVRILERGDFGEFEAMRSVLTNERRVLNRGADTRARNRAKKAKKKAKQAKARVRA